MRTTCNTHPIFRDLIILIVPGEAYNPCR